MAFIYASIATTPVNVGSYVITNSGVQFSENVPELDAFVGLTLTRTDSSTNSVRVNKRYSLDSDTIPVILVPNGTVAADGVITLGTALQFVYPKAWVFLPAGAVVGGSAGLYYATFSSTTVGIVKTNYVNAATTAFAPSTPTTIGDAAVGSAAGYVTVVTTDSALANITIQANKLGATGRLELKATFATSSSANAKTIKGSFGNMVALAAVPTTSLSLEVEKTIYNQATNVQVSSSAAAATGSGAGGVLVKGAVDTTAAVQFIITGQHHTADAGVAHIVLESFTLELIAD